MAKLAFIDDHIGYAKLLASPFMVAGHEVQLQTAPVDFEKLMRFRADLIVFGLTRKRITFNRAIQDIHEDVLGYKAIIESEQYPAVNVIPIVLVGVAIEESDIPTSINYDAYLILPDDIDHFVPLVEELASNVKTRRRISDYVCPTCGSRLTYTMKPIRDLFCPRCHTAVTLIDDENGVCTTRGGQQHPCRIEDLRPPESRHHN